MPTRPYSQTLINNSADILNAITNQASVDFKNYVPLVEPNSDSIRAFGAVIMAYPNLQNEFLNALVNRIARVVVTSKFYENPWQFCKKGLLEYGETIEEIFVNLARPFTFNPDTAEKEVFKREIPDIKADFHVMNYQKFYKTTVTQQQLRQAFLSVEGVTDLISKIVDSMYTGANYDEYLVMKYMLCRCILDNKIATSNFSKVSDIAFENAVIKARELSNNFTILSGKYNIAGVRTSTLKNNQYIFISSEMDAAIDVTVLASAFNMDKADFMGHKVLIDSFTDHDEERLSILLADGVNKFVPFTSAEKEALSKVVAVIMDIDFMQIYDNLIEFTENYNGQGLYWNYFLHVWITFSISPFSNAAVIAQLTANSTTTISALTYNPLTMSKALGNGFVGTVKQSVAPISGPLTVTYANETGCVKDVRIKYELTDDTKANITRLREAGYNFDCYVTSTGEAVFTAYEAIDKLFKLEVYIKASAETNAEIISSFRWVLEAVAS